MAEMISIDASVIRIGQITKEMLVCNVCKEVLVDPVFSCKNWHPICGVCFPQLHRTQCYCSDQLREIQCMSRILKSIYPEVTCRNLSFGCTVNVPTDKMLEHVKSCSFRPIKCNLLSGNDMPCSRRLCVPQQAYRHFVMEHKLQPTTFQAIEETNFFFVRHALRVPYAALRAGGEFWKPVYFSSSDEFLLVPWVVSGILVWWVVVEEVNNVSSRYSYETAIQYDAPEDDNKDGDDKQYLIVGRNMPVYGIRFYWYQNLHDLKGCFSSCSLNTLFHKKYGSKDYVDTDYVTITISVKMKVS